MKDFSEMCKNYENIEKISKAGQKVVYRAFHRDYGNVVIKLYLQLDNPRALREIEIEKQLNLSMIPKIYETGIVKYFDEETVYIIEEWIEGVTLRNYLNSGKKFSLSEAVDFLEQGLRFIQLLEQNNIVHRDIKPENIIKTKDNKFYFLDFGIARILNAESLTDTGAYFGPHTPGYAAPEQFNNLKDQIDSRADIFSLGVVTYECLSGVNPFLKNATSELEILQNTETITPVQFTIVGDTQRQFMGLLSAMMNKYASRRPLSAKEAMAMLNALKPTLDY